MTPQRWEQVKDLLGTALSIPEKDRAQFLSTRCGDDTELREEVLSLLAAHEDAGEFMETPAVDLRAAVERETEPDLAGVRVGAYEIVKEIGRGGMGAVYLGVRADNEFRKRVAIKLIRGGMESDFAIRRFRNERQILARLEHPNIARLIDGGSTGKGPFFVMEYVEGEPLLVYCESRSLPVRERLEIFLKICSAVQYAHRRMIVHRDLKPNNVLVKQDGTPKLLDFGIAKLLDPTTGPDSDSTLTAFRLITPAYASPEQVRGEAGTVRSDIYSLGVILFELIAGRQPPGSGVRRTFTLPESGPDDTVRLLVRNLRNVVLKAVRPDQAERYESVDALVTDIQKAMAGEAIPTYGAGEGPGGETPQEGSIAVLPFQLLGTDSTSETYLGLGITDAVITRLSNVGRISVRPTGAVMKFAAGGDALEAGRELNVQYVLEGRVQKARNRVRVTVQLLELEKRAPVWAARFDEEFEDLLRVEDSISEQVAQALVPQLTGEERRKLASPGTSSSKAHQAYLRGRWHWSKRSAESLVQALVLFNEAITEDPKYGRAHAGIADYYIELGVRGVLPASESFSAAIQSAGAAIEFDPQLAEAHASYGFALWARDRDYEKAVHHLQLAIALNPDYAVAHDWFGLVNCSRGKEVIAQASIERARKLDPNSCIYQADMALCLYNARHFQEAIGTFTATECDLGVEGFAGTGSELDGVSAVNGAVMPLSLLAMGNAPAARDAARSHADATEQSPIARGLVALTESACGNTAAAEATLAALEEESVDRYIPGMALALANLACGRKQEAITQLERAQRDRDWWTMWLDHMAVWDPLRDDPRFQGFAQHLPESAATAKNAVPVPAALPPPRAWWHSPVVAVVGLLLALVLAAALIYPRLGAPAKPFQNVRLSKLTTNGTAECAAISADGKFVAYTQRSEGRISVWVRDMEKGSAQRIGGPYNAQIPSLEFTGAGDRVVYVTQPASDPLGGALYVGSAAGGVPRLTVNQVAGPAGVSADGSRFAFYRPAPSGTGDQLVIVEVDGSGALTERVVPYRPRPGVFAAPPGPVWSPDGKHLVCAVRGPLPAGFGVSLEIVDPGGTARPLPTPPWQTIAKMVWLKDSSGLMVAGQSLDEPFKQIWYVPLMAGGAVRVTNDLSYYDAVDVTADKSAMVSVQAQPLTNLYTLTLADPTHPVQITPGGGRYYDVAWTPDGNLVYASDATGSADIWIMDPKGGAPRQLTNGLARSYAPAISPDGRTVVFHSNRNGVWNLWRMGLDGSNQTQITHHTTDSNRPQVTADGASVIYQHVGGDASVTLWKAPLQGGDGTQITSGLASFPAVSREDGRIAFWYCPDPAVSKWQIGVLEPGSDTPKRAFEFPDNREPGALLRWVPGMNAISYAEERDGASNIWLQSLSGGPPRQLTNFTKGLIYSFDWSREGLLVYSQGMSTRDVVLMRDPAKMRQ